MNECVNCLLQIKTNTMSAADDKMEIDDSLYRLSLVMLYGLICLVKQLCLLEIF